MLEAERMRGRSFTLRLVVMFVVTVMVGGLI
jgi:hypothetical protein